MLRGILNPEFRETLLSKLMQDFFNGQALQDAQIELCEMGLTRPKWYNNQYGLFLLVYRSKPVVIARARPWRMS